MSEVWLSPWCSSQHPCEQITPDLSVLQINNPKIPSHICLIVSRSPVDILDNIRKQTIGW